MGKLRVMSGREVVALLESQGFVQVRQRGSHAVMQLEFSDTTITLPVPLHRELKLGTLVGIIRQSQLPRTLFES